MSTPGRKLEIPNMSYVYVHVFISILITVSTYLKVYLYLPIPISASVYICKSIFMCVYSFCLCKHISYIALRNMFLLKMINYINVATRQIFIEH